MKVNSIGYRFSTITFGQDSFKGYKTKILRIIAKHYLNLRGYTLVRTNVSNLKSLTYQDERRYSDYKKFDKIFIKSHKKKNFCSDSLFYD